MATEIIPGQRTWSMTRDAEGHRTYKIVHRVTGAVTDGPANVLQTPGLPVPGSFWDFDGDLDLWAWCRADAAVTPLVEGEKNTQWDVEQTFSTKPPDRDKQRCQDQQIENPLLEPPQISGGLQQGTEEATADCFGRPVCNSAWEQLRGPQVEFNVGRDTVTIKMNVPVLNLTLLSAMKNTVNAYPLWGFPRRCVLLASYTWERRFHGQCSVYYTVTLEFQTNPSTFDRDVLDEGTKALHGHWNDDGAWVPDNLGGAPPSRFIPSHFIQVQDRNGNPMRVILNGQGVPADDSTILKPLFNDSGAGRRLALTPPDENTSDGLTPPTGLVITKKKGGKLTAGADHDYLVTALDSQGETTQGDVVRVTPDSTNRGVELVWNEVANATSYRVYRQRFPADADAYLIGIVTGGLNGPGQIRVARYSESDPLLLGIPATL